MGFYVDPQQELFTALKLRLEAKGYAVYEGFLPPENTPYPFIYLGDMQQIDTPTKSAVIGTINPTIHVWHNNPKQRGTVSYMMADIKATCRGIDETENYSWLWGSMTSRIIPDDTTKEPLLHGIVEPEVKFS